MGLNPSKEMDMKNIEGFLKVHVPLPLTPSANTYSNVIGTIDLREQGGYLTAQSGKIELREPFGTGALGEYQGGSYVNR